VNYWKDGEISKEKIYEVEVIIFDWSNTCRIMAGSKHTYLFSGLVL
jgi:hypothetical protein